MDLTEIDRDTGNFTKGNQTINRHSALDYEEQPRFYRHARGSKSLNCNHTGSKHDFQLLVWKKAKDGEANSVHFQIFKVYNDLPDNVVHSASINTSKGRLDGALKGLLVKYNPKPFNYV